MKTPIHTTSQRIGEHVIDTAPQAKNVAPALFKECCDGMQQDLARVLEQTKHR
jgi:hypothetical protein